MSEKLLETLSEGVLTLSLNKPEVRNAIDPEVMDALTSRLKAASTDPDVRVIVIRGSGGHFCAGADIKSAMSSTSGDSLADAAYRTLTESYAPAQLAIRDCPKPVIAAVEGYAAGFGCDIALRCDLRLVSENAVFTELFIRVGLIPDGGGTWLLPRLVGLGRALEMMFTGKNVGAQEAVAIGLANQILPADDFQNAVQQYAAELAKKAPLALERGKRAMLATLENPDFATALAQEALLQREIFNSEDGVEGFSAFVEKREPQWKGR